MQALGNVKNFLQIIAQVDMIFIALRLAQDLADKVFDQNGLVTVRLVLRRPGLEVKTDGRRCGRFNLRKLTNLFTRNHAFLAPYLYSDLRGRTFSGDP